MFQDQLRQQGISNERIITVNLDDFENKALRNPETLHQFVLNRCNDTDTYYIFIDEVQMCKNFLEVWPVFLGTKIWISTLQAQMPFCFPASWRPF